MRNGLWLHQVDVSDRWQIGGSGYWLCYRIVTDTEDASVAESIALESACDYWECGRAVARVSSTITYKIDAIVTGIGDGSVKAC